MTGPAVTDRHRSEPAVGERVELARYAVGSQERVLYGQRVDGVVRVTDVPSAGMGRAYLVERGLERDGYDAVKALVEDYVTQATELGAVPMSISPLGLYLERLRS